MLTEPSGGAVNKGAFVRCSSCRMTPQPPQPDCHRGSHHLPNREGKAATHIELAARQFGLPKDSVILLEQIRTLDKKRLREHMGRVDGPMMHRVDAAIAVSFGLHPDTLV